MFKPQFYRAAIIFAVASISNAALGSVQFTGLDGNGREAFAEFSATGSNLVIKLSNTALTDVLSVGDAHFQSDLLSAVFFDLTTASLLTLQTAVASGPLGIYQQDSSQNSVANGTLVLSSVANLAAPGSTNGGPGSFQGGWQYRESASSLSGVSQKRGLGTNGLGIFNGNEVKVVDNLDYALTSLEDDVTTSQAQQLFNFPVILNTITFTLSGLPSGFVVDETTVTNVRFQYGTNLTEPSITDTTGEQPPPPVGGTIPEPTSVAVWSLILGLATFITSRTK